MSTIAPDIEAFLREYLTRQRDASPHTCDSYAHSFQMLFEFAARTLKVSPSRLTLEQLDTPLISAFLEHLKQVRGNSPETRNVRLAAIRSFFRFLEYRHPEALNQIRRVLAIPFKKTDSRLVPYLTPEELHALLDAPDPTTRDGIRDRAMMHVAVCAGLRVSELTGLTLVDVASPAGTIRVHGKGRRQRAIPLWKITATALRAWLTIRGTVAVAEVFINARSEPMSRWGFAYVLNRHVQTAQQHCPSISSKQISPHVLRHTCAMMVLQATHDIRKVSLWLGHANQATTEIYTRADPTEKLEAINAMVPPPLRKGTFRPPDKLIAWLKDRSYGE
jgi:integrase/recombinase XerD